MKIIDVRHYNCQALANISGNFPEILGKFPENFPKH